MLQIFTFISVYRNSLWLFFSICLLVSNWGYQYSSKTFLFSLVNKPGWAPVKLSQTGKYSSYRFSIYSCSSYGPNFGGGDDILITNYASSNTNSFTNLGYTYSPPSGHSYGSSFTKSFLAGSYKFQPDEVEVFYESTKWSSDDIQNSSLHLFTNNRSRLFCLGCLWAKATNWDKAWTDQFR